MAESVIYIRSSAVDPAARIDFAEPAVLADMVRIADLSPDAIGAVSAALERRPGLLNPGAMRELIQETVADADSGLAVFRVLQTLDAGDLDRAMARLRDVRTRADAGLNDERMAALERNLATLIRQYPAVARYQQAARLSAATGQPLASAELFCDFRPVFDEKAAAIECMVPITTLRLVKTNFDGLPVVFEAELSAEQVHRLSDVVQRAKLKLQTMRDAHTVWMKDAVPDLPSTRMPGDETTHD